MSDQKAMEVASDLFWATQMKCATCGTKLLPESEPKLLLCLHNICKKCTSSKDNSSLTCIFCKTTVSDLRNLKDNIFVIRYMIDSINKETVGFPASHPKKDNEEANSAKVTSEAKTSPNSEDKGEPVKSPLTSNHACSSCDEKTSMVAFCQSCEGPICDSCEKAHKKLKEFKTHSIEKRNQKKEHAIHLIKKLTTCSVHDEPFSIFCELCEELICPKCIEVGHRGHKAEKIIDQKSWFLNKVKLETKEWMNKTQEKKMSVDQVFDDILQSELNLNRMERNFKSQIMSFERQLKQWIDDYISLIFKKLDDSYKEQKEDFQKMRSTLKQTRDSFKYLENFTKEILDQNYLVGILKNKSFIQKQINDNLVKNIPKPKSIPNQPDIQSIIDGKAMANSFLELLNQPNDPNEITQLFFKYLEDLITKVNKNNNENSAGINTNPQTTETTQVRLTEPNTKQAESNTKQAEQNPRQAEPKKFLEQKQLSNQNSESTQKINDEQKLSVVRPMFPRQPKLSPILSPPVPQQVLPVVEMQRIMNGRKNISLPPPPPPPPPQEHHPQNINSMMICHNNGYPQFPRNYIAAGQPPGCSICLLGPDSSGILVRCSNCHRFFHSYCHIPPVEQKFMETWKCIMCTNINIQHTGQEFALPHKLICSKILLRLISQLNSTKHRHHMQMTGSIYLPENVDRGERLVNFEVVKAHLWGKGQQYKNVVQFLTDVKVALDTLRTINHENPPAIEDIQNLEQFFLLQVGHELSTQYKVYFASLQSSQEPGTNEYANKKPRLEK